MSDDAYKTVSWRWTSHVFVVFVETEARAQKRGGDGRTRRNDAIRMS